MISAKDFWNKRAAGYAKQPIADQASYEKKLEMTRQYLTPDTKLMEIGCGTGSTAIIHAPVVKEVYAIDISSKMIEIANQKATAKNIHNITFEAAAIDELNIQFESFDVVLALNILHLVENPRDVIERMYNILKPGGVLISSTACFDGFPRKVIKVVMPVAQLVNLAPPTNIFSTKDFEGYIQNTGFQIEATWRPKRDAAIFMIAKKRALN